MSRKKTLIICGIILGVAALVTIIIFNTEPSAQKRGATKQTAMLVDVTTVNRGTYSPNIVATGTVQPSRDIMLSPRVSGEIIDMSDAFVPGGYAKKGEVLLQIDPSDYRNTLEQRKSDLEQQRANLDMEMGRQEVAQQELDLIGDTLMQDTSLVLRKPQLNQVKAQLKAAEASVNQAELNLQRTTIRAPFDAHILSRNANIGSQVNVGDMLGRLVGRDEYWVNVTVPVGMLRWLSFPGEDGEGSPVKVRNRTAWPDSEFRTGQLYKRIGSLEEQTRLARVLVTIPDPLAYETDSSEVPGLLIGAFVETKITGNPVKNVVRLNRDYLRKDETVWVMKDGKLSIRKVEILLKDSKYAYITEGLEDGEKVVTTNLSTVSDGAPLRTGASGANTENVSDTTSLGEDS